VSPSRAGAAAGRSERRIAPARRTAVDIRGSLALVGLLLKYLSLSALFPAAFAVGYGEPIVPFVGAAALGFAAGFGIERGLGGTTRIGFREGYLVVALTWVAAALFGALPFVLSGDSQLDRPLDALFESMSGFTATGASVVTDVDAVDRSLLMWRQFTQWLGGMGIIVLALAVLPRLRVGGRQLLESELPGPEIDQLADRIRDTARRLWLLYVALTALLFVLLAAIGFLGDSAMGPYQALAHALTTMPTGGFSTEPNSVAAFGAAAQWVIAVFMIVAGVNYALLYAAFVRRTPRALLPDEELRVYLVLLTLGAILVAAEIWDEGIASGERAIRDGVFQSASIMTTTGFASVDFVGWPTLALMTLVLLMFVGGCAGSTSGSIKVVRHLLLGKSLRRELRQTVHPEEVVPIRLNRRPLDERALRAATAFILLYMGIFILGAGVIAIDAAYQGPDLSPLDAIAASATMVGNVGPGLGIAGPTGSFANYSDVSTVTMTILMWLGRLEVIPVLVLATRRYWRV
jgi:trk system potassium uptake protein TrkH